MAARAKRGKTRDAPSSSAGPRKDRKVLDRRRRSCFFCREKIAAVDYKNITQLRRFISERGKIKGRATRAPAGNTRSRWRSRSNERARWRFCPTSVIPRSSRRDLARARPSRSRGEFGEAPVGA